MPRFYPETLAISIDFEAEDVFNTVPSHQNLAIGSESQFSTENRPELRRKSKMRSSRNSSFSDEVPLVNKLVLRHVTCYVVH